MAVEGSVQAGLLTLQAGFQAVFDPPPLYRNLRGQGFGIDNYLNNLTRQQLSAACKTLWQLIAARPGLLDPARRHSPEDFASALDGLHQTSKPGKTLLMSPRERARHNGAKVSKSLPLILIGEAKRRNISVNSFGIVQPGLKSIDLRVLGFAGDFGEPLKPSSLPCGAGSVRHRRV